MKENRLAWATRILLLCLVTGGIALRIYDLGYPDSLVFDEHHFVENARNYLAQRSDWNDHPPLGKMLIAVGMLAVGDNSTGWRLASLLFGVALILLAYFLGAAAFRSRDAGLYAAAFVAGSGFLIVYSKTAHLDGILATLMLAAAVTIWYSHTWLGFLVAAFVIGLATSIKFSGVVIAIPWAIVAIHRLGFTRRTIALLAAGAGLTAGVYVGLFSLGLRLAGDPYGITDVARKTYELLQHHLGLQDWKHPATSRWYTWFIPLNRLDMHHVRQGNLVRAITTADDPVLWWGVNLAVLWAALLAVRRRAAVPGRSYLLLLWLVPLLPWILTNRDSYIYHYLPSYVFGLILLGGSLTEVEKSAFRFAFVTAVTAIFVFCAPVWAHIPFAADSWLHRILY